MGKDEAKEDSGFGFKDKAKAEETLRLLESHEPQYRRLTVRGLLGRAKRVLSLTKAEEKVKNIKEAMAVFEEWLAQLDKEKNGTDKKSEKTEEKKSEKSEEKRSDKNDDRKSDRKSDNKGKKDDDSDSDSDVEMEDETEKKEKSPPPASDSVPGLGFKDPEAAHGTLKALEGRDPDYQKLAVKGLIGRAKRVLTCTKDETKVKNIKEAMSIFDKFLDDFDSQHRSKENNPYLPLAVVEGCYRLAVARNLNVDSVRGFVEAYRGVRGEYKRLRTVAGEGGVTWDIIRNKALKELKEKHAEAKLFDAAGDPSDAHAELVLWAYSPEATRVKRINFPLAREPDAAAEAAEAAGAAGAGRKRRSSGGDEDAAKRRRE